jgi:hypothetical protein
MFATLVTLKLHKFQLQEAMEIWEKSKEEYLPDIEGLIDITTLIELEEDKIIRIATWESEKHLQHAVESGLLQKIVEMYGHLLAEPPVIETFHMAMRDEFSKPKVKVGK